MEFELMKEQLNGEYRKVFEAAWIYGIMKNVSNEMLIDRLTELYDILLTAQTEGRDVRRIAGSSHEVLHGDAVVARRCHDLCRLLQRGTFRHRERLRDDGGLEYLDDLVNRLAAHQRVRTGMQRIFRTELR